jgi:hypothetical protein
MGSCGRRRVRGRCSRCSSRASVWGLTPPTRSLPTRSGNDGQRADGRRRRRPARPARRRAACGSGVDPAHLGGASLVLGRDAALVGRSRERRTASPRLDRTSPRRQVDGPAQFRWGRRRFRAVSARVGDAAAAPSPRGERRDKFEGRQTGGPPRRHVSLSRPLAGGVGAMPGARAAPSAGAAWAVPSGCSREAQASPSQLHLPDGGVRQHGLGRTGSPASALPWG